MNLNTLTKDVHEYAKEKGWWSKPRSDEEVIMLMVTEIAEATECVRNSEPHHHYGPNPSFPDNDRKDGGDKFILPTMIDRARLDAPKKPEGEAVELVDCQIRIADFCGYAGINLEEEMKKLATDLAEDRYYLTRLRRANPLERHLAVVECLAQAGRCAYRGGMEQVAQSVTEAFYMIQKIFEINDWKWEAILLEKMSYNQKRPYRHGGKAY